MCKYTVNKKQSEQLSNNIARSMSNKRLSLILLHHQYCKHLSGKCQCKATAHSKVLFPREGATMHKQAQSMRSVDLLRREHVQQRRASCFAMRTASRTVVERTSNFGINCIGFLMMSSFACDRSESTDVIHPASQPASQRW